MILVTSRMLCCERINYNVTKFPIIRKFDSITHNTLKKTRRTGKGNVLESPHNPCIIHRLSFPDKLWIDRKCCLKEVCDAYMKRPSEQSLAIRNNSGGSLWSPSVKNSWLVVLPIVKKAASSSSIGTPKAIGSCSNLLSFSHAAQTTFPVGKTFTKYVHCLTQRDRAQRPIP